MIEIAALVLRLCNRSVCPSYYLAEPLGFAEWIALHTRGVLGLRPDLSLVQRADWLL